VEAICFQDWSDFVTCDLNGMTCGMNSRFYDTAWICEYVKNGLKTADFTRKKAHKSAVFILEANRRLEVIADSLILR
jgi:hypothetical protein